MAFMSTRGVNCTGFVSLAVAYTSCVSLTSSYLIIHYLVYSSCIWGQLRLSISLTHQKCWREESREAVLWITHLLPTLPEKDKLIRYTSFSPRRWNVSFIFWYKVSHDRRTNVSHCLSSLWPGSNSPRPWRSISRNFSLADHTRFLVHSLGRTKEQSRAP